MRKPSLLLATLLLVLPVLFFSGCHGSSYDHDRGYHRPPPPHGDRYRPQPPHVEPRPDGHRPPHYR